MLKTHRIKPNMKVSVIIPAFNEEDVIEGCLRSLESQTFRDFEAIFVDDQSSDGTRALLESFCSRHSPRFQVRDFGKVGPGKARNLVAIESQADVLAFMDADCEASPQWLELLMGTYQGEQKGDLQIASVGGPQLAHPSSTEVQLAIDTFFRQFSKASDFYKERNLSPPRPTLHNPLCNTSYRRGLFLQMGGFREDLFPGEDWELDFRLRRQGYQIYFHPSAYVFHHRPESVQQFRKIMFAYGRAQGKLVRDHGSHRGIHRLAVATFTVVLLVGVVFVWLAVTQSIIAPLIVFSLSLASMLWIQPRSHRSWSLCWHALQWFRGFWEGFFKRQSLPPGAKS